MRDLDVPITKGEGVMSVYCCLMTDFEVCDNSGSLHVDTVAAALVAVQSAGNNAQAVSAGSK